MNELPADVATADEESEFYPTPLWLIESFIDDYIKRTEMLTGHGHLLDPAAGDGRLLLPFQEFGIDVRGFELREDLQQLCVGNGVPCAQRDSLTKPNWGAPSWIIMNPPFSMAEEFFRRAIDEVRRGGSVAVLLRLGFLASQKREDFHDRFKTDLYVSPRRPPFAKSKKTGKLGSDNSDYAWFVNDSRSRNGWKRLQLVNV